MKGAKEREEAGTVTRLRRRRLHSPDEEVAGRAGEELRSGNVRFEVLTGRPGDVKPAVGHMSLHFGGAAQPGGVLHLGAIHRQTV